MFSNLIAIWKPLISSNIFYVRKKDLIYCPSLNIKYATLTVYVYILVLVFDFFHQITEFDPWFFKNVNHVSLLLIKNVLEQILVTNRSVNRSLMTCQFPWKWNMPINCHKQSIKPRPYTYAGCWRSILNISYM